MRNHILIACMPKSGSTYLSTIISNLPKYRRVRLVPAWGAREQELDAYRLRINSIFNYVAQNHVRYSEYTRLLIIRYKLKPVVLVRNIFDIVCSTRDHFKIESITGPAAYVPRDILNLSDEHIEDFIVNMIIPWYFNFYLSWKECSDSITVNYDELSNNPEGLIRNIVQFHNLQIDVADQVNAIEKAQKLPTRKNQAVAGRGNSLSDSTKDRIRTYARFYPDVDFSDIGIQ